MQLLRALPDRRRHPRRSRALAAAAQELAEVDRRPPTSPETGTHRPEGRLLPEGSDTQQPVEQEQTGITNNPSAAQLQTSSDVPATAAVNEKLRYVAIVSAQVTYDDNIFISHFDRESDVIFSLSPTIAVGIGDVRPEFRRLMLDTFSPAEIDQTYNPRSFLFVRYTPTGRLFIDHPHENAVDHDAALLARWQMAYLTLGMRSQFQHLSGVLMSTPDQNLIRSVLVSCGIFNICIMRPLRSPQPTRRTLVSRATVATVSSRLRAVNHDRNAYLSVSSASLGAAGGCAAVWAGGVCEAGACPAGGGAGACAHSTAGTSASARP